MPETSSIFTTDKFGITLILTDVAFSAELQRDSLDQIMSDIDAQLTENGAPDDSDSRVELIMEQVSAMTEMVVLQQIEHAAGVADIAYSFIYCLGKTVGFDQIEHIRGLTGSYMRNVLLLNPCLGELEYQTETEILRKAMNESPNGDWGLDYKRPPTVH